MREERRVHNQQVHSLYRSLNIAREIKSRRVKWARLEARMEEVFSEF